MRVKQRNTATREDLLWEMDKKTAALKLIHRLCNEILEADDGPIPGKPAYAILKKARYMAGAAYPAMAPQSGDRLEVIAL